MGSDLQAQRDLLRSERELADFFEHAAIPMHWIGPDGTILRANQAELELLGYHREEYVGRKITDFHVDPSVIEDILQRLARGEKLIGLPARLRHRDGTIRDVQISSSVLFEGGEFIHTRCVTLDVTEQQRTGQALRESEERYRSLTELLPVAVYVCEAPSGVITYYNERAVRLWGRAPRPGDHDERFCGSEQMLLPDGTPLAHRDCPMAVALREGRSYRNEEVILRRPDGSRITVLVNIDPIRDSGGRVVGAVNVFHDMTELKQAQRALREQKESLETLLDTLPIAVFLAHDPECRRISGNRAAAELLRMPQGANLSKTAPPAEVPSHFVTLREGEPVAAENLPIQRAARGEVVHDEPLDHQFEDGTLVHTLISAQPLYEADGRPRGAVAAILDVTPLKRAETALREADRRKDAFLATLAHELRNPLAPVGYALEIMKTAGGEAAVFERARQMMERQLKHLVRLVDDLLDVSRITRDRMELRRQRVELASTIEQALELCRPLLEEAEHDLTVDLPPEPVTLSADPVRLAQVFGNLINNACKYTEPGGRISITAERQAGEVVVKVRDSGVGLAPESLPHVFDMFRPADPSPTHRQGGLGLGLTLVKRLVEMHGGSIAASSEGRGRGSEFAVRLPVLDAPEPVKAEPTAVAAPPSRRILVVDDNHDAAGALATLLAMAGNETHVAHDGIEAVAAAERLRPEVVLLDIGLPSMDGYDVCRTIRRHDWSDRTVVVALTGWGQDGDRRRSREAGFDGHLVKPVDYESLVPFLSGEARSQPPEP